MFTQRSVWGQLAYACVAVLLISRAGTESFGAPPQTLFEPSGFRFDSAIHIAASGNNAAAVWCSNGPIGNTYGVLCRRSADSGATWSPTQVLNHNTSATIAFEDSAFVAAESQDLWGCVWSSEDITTGVAGGLKQILFERSTDGGQTWGAPVSLSALTTPSATRHYAPAMASSASGTWVAVWEADEITSTTLGIDSDLLFVRSNDHGQTWSIPAPLNSDASFDAHTDVSPQIATDGNGVWVAVWQGRVRAFPSVTDYEICFSRSTDDGLTWSAPAYVNTDAASDTNNDLLPRLATDRAGNWVVVWACSWIASGACGDDLVFARSFNNGASWTSYSAMFADAASNARIDSAPSIAYANGTYHVAFEARQPTGTAASDCDVLYCNSDNGGATWASPVAVNSNASAETVLDRAPCVATPSAGPCVIAWLVGHGASEGALVANAPTTSSIADWSMY